MIASPYQINIYSLHEGTGDEYLAQVMAVSAGRDGKPWTTPFGKPFTGHSVDEVRNAARRWLADSGLIERAVA